MELILVAVIIILFIVLLLLRGVKTCRPQTSLAEQLFIAAALVAAFAFFIGMLFHSNPYHRAVDPVDNECYSPFGDRQLPSVLFYATTFYVGLFLLWWKGLSLPPLSAVLSAVFVALGAILSILLCIQLLGHDTSSLDMYASANHLWLLFLLPAWNAVSGICILTRLATQGINRASSFAYKNPALNKLNNLLASRLHAATWVIVLLLPMLLLCTLVLMLFGQEYNALVKVFTDTSTWTFSQKMHPPVLDHQGHYLCTVAAKGSPQTVKPLRLGTRHGRTIIVNRQLQVANAFEEWVQNTSPSMHRRIRRWYDNYGYNLSLKINTKRRSDVTYILMKPLEWGFLLCLYLFCSKPEERISRQYSRQTT